MIRLFALCLMLLPVAAQAAPRLNAVVAPDRTVAMMVVAALFYWGFKWRAR